MQTEPLGQTNGKPLVFEEPGAIGFKQAVYLGEDQTLQRSQVVVHHKAFQGSLPLRFERFNVLPITGLTGVSVVSRRVCQILTSLESAAMPKTRLSFAIDFLSVIASGLATYCSYKDRKVGRCSTGNNGAHSWKKMLIIWSDTRRGGALKEMGRFGECGTDGLDTVPKKAFELTSEHDLPDSCARCLKDSAIC